MTAPGWANGWPMGRLEELAAEFNAWDGSFALGAFSKVKERDVATWLTAERLVERGDGLAVINVMRTKATIKDFTGEARLTQPAGTLAVKHLAPRDPAILAARLAALATTRDVTVEGYIENARHGDIMTKAGLRLSAVKIRASSELVGVWTNWAPPAEFPKAEAAGIALLADGTVPAAALALAREEAETLTLVDHYSGYNVGKSWKAVALRGFGDSTFVEKPAEMSKAWKAANPERLESECAWTDAWAPTLRSLAENIGGAGLERVRVMVLEPGGRLERHADITDRNAGVADGKIMRLHLPLSSPPGCTFTSWGLDGRPHGHRMTEGSWWYLDVRKPHRAVNESALPRVHLVADCVATPALRARLP